MSYNDSHRALLQAIMERGAVSSTDVRELVIKLFQQNESTHTYIHQINKKLETLNMTISNVACEITGKKYWVLVSTILDETAKFQTEFSTAQLELVRKILSEIVSSVNGSVASTVCLNLCSTLDSKMSKADAEHFLTVMVEKRWFVKQDGKFYIGVRSIAELIPYFRTTYAEDVLNTCSLCRQVVFHGERCIYCQEVLHLSCFANSARVQNPPKCPSCSNIMTTENIENFEGYNDDHTMDFPGIDSQQVDINDVRKRGQKKRHNRSIALPGPSSALGHDESMAKRSQRVKNNHSMNLPGTSSGQERNQTSRIRAQRKKHDHSTEVSEASDDSIEDDGPKRRFQRQRR